MVAGFDQLSNKLNTSAGNNSKGALTDNGNEKMKVEVEQVLINMSDNDEKNDEFEHF